MQKARRKLGLFFFLSSVMPALVAGIHVFFCDVKTWVPGTRPGMTLNGRRITRRRS
jgi:hypothetical protein